MARLILAVLLMLIHKSYQLHISLKNFSINDRPLDFRQDIICASRMNSDYKVKKDWKCSLVKNQKHQVECLCSIEYECYEYEEFILESELVDFNYYMSKEFFLGKNYRAKNLAYIYEETVCQITKKLG